MKFGKAKMWAAAIGGTLTAGATFAATLVGVLDDGAWDFEEYGLVAVALATLIGTVRAVWHVENKPLISENTR